MTNAEIILNLYIEYTKLIETYLSFILTMAYIEDSY